MNWMINSTPRGAVLHDDLFQSWDIFVLLEPSSHHLLCYGFIHQGLLEMIVVGNHRSLVIPNDHIRIHSAGFVWITNYGTLDQLLDVRLSPILADCESTFALPPSSLHRPLNEYHTSRGSLLLHGSVLLIFHNLADAFDVYVPLVCPLPVMLLLLVVARLYDCRGLIIILTWHDSAVIHAAVLVVLSPGRGTSIFHEGQLLSLHGGIKHSFV